MGKRQVSKATDRSLVLVLSLSSCVTLGKSFYFSEIQARLFLQNEDVVQMSLGPSLAVSLSKWMNLRSFSEVAQGTLGAQEVGRGC